MFLTAVFQRLKSEEQNMGFHIISHKFTGIAIPIGSEHNENRTAKTTAVRQRIVRFSWIENSALKYGFLGPMQILAEFPITRNAFIIIDWIVVAVDLMAKIVIELHLLFRKQKGKLNS